MLSRIIVSLITLFTSAILSASGLPQQSIVLPGYEHDSVMNRMRQLPLHHIEGIWQFTDNGATIAIERYSPDDTPDNNTFQYRMIIINSPRLSIYPGTLMGIITPTAKQGIYDSHIYTDFDGGTALSGAKRFFLTLHKDSRLSFSRDKSGLKFNLWRFLPYMFRYSVRYKNDIPDNLDGCIRIFPVPTQSPINPRYL